MLNILNDDDEFSPSLIFQPRPTADMEVWAAIPHPSRAMVNVWSSAGRFCCRGISGWIHLLPVPGSLTVCPWKFTKVFQPSFFLRGELLNFGRCTQHSRMMCFGVWDCRFDGKDPPGWLMLHDIPVVDLHQLATKSTIPSGEYGWCLWLFCLFFLGGF